MQNAAAPLRAMCRFNHADFSASRGSDRVPGQGEFERPSSGDSVASGCHSRMAPPARRTYVAKAPTTRPLEFTS